MVEMERTSSSHSAEKLDGQNIGKLVLDELDGKPVAGAEVVQAHNAAFAAALVKGRTNAFSWNTLVIYACEPSHLMFSDVKIDFRSRHCHCFHLRMHIRIRQLTHDIHKRHVCIPKAIQSGYVFRARVLSPPDTAPSGKLDATTGIIFAIYTVGQMVGSLGASQVCDRFGRRAGMFTGNVIILIATAIIASSSKREQFIAGRFVLGMGVSVAIIGAPTYAVEMAPPQWR